MQNCEHERRRNKDNRVAQHRFREVKQRHGFPPPLQNQSQGVTTWARDVRSRRYVHRVNAARNSSRKERRKHLRAALRRYPSPCVMRVPVSKAKSMPEEELGLSIAFKDLVRLP